MLESFAYNHSLRIAVCFATPMTQAVVHKASDELCTGPGGAPAFSPRIQRLRQWLSERPGVAVVDPLDRTEVVSGWSGLVVSDPFKCTEVSNGWCGIS